MAWMRARLAAREATLAWVRWTPRRSRGGVPSRWVPPPVCPPSSPPRPRLGPRRPRRPRAASACASARDAFAAGRRTGVLRAPRAVRPARRPRRRPRRRSAWRSACAGGGGRVVAVGAARRRPPPPARHGDGRARVGPGLGRRRRRAAAARRAAAGAATLRRALRRGPGGGARRVVRRARARARRPGRRRRRRSSRAPPGAATASRRAPTPDFGDVQVAFVHHTVSANDYAPEDSAGDRPGDRQVPPRHQRVERLRLQLPRRQVRPDLRGPRRRDRPGRHRRPGAGLQLALDRHRQHRDVLRRRRRPTPRSTRWRRLIAWKLPLHGAPVDRAGRR